MALQSEKIITCLACGKKIKATGSAQKYCPECAKKRHSKGLNPSFVLCRYTKSCVYGSYRFCNFLECNGFSRQSTDAPIIDGKCKHYKRGKKKEKLDAFKSDVELTRRKDACVAN